MASRDTRDGFIQAHALAHPDISFFGLAAAQVLIYCLQNAQSNFTSGYGAAMTVVTYTALSLCLLAVSVAALRGWQLPSAWDWVVSVAGAPLLLLALVPFYLPAPLRAAASCGAGAVLGWMYVRWAPFYARLPIGDAVACVFVSMASGSLVKLAGDLMPAPPRACLLSLLPLACFALLRRADRVMPRADESPLIFESGRTLPLSPKLLIGIAAYSLVIGVSRGIALPLEEGAVSSYDIVQHFAEVFLAGAVMWWVFGRSGGLRFPGLWNLSAVIALTGLFLVPIVGGEGSALALAFVFCAQTMTVMLLWLVLADVARHDARSPYAVFGAGWLAYSLPFAAGEAAGLIARHAGIATMALLLLGYVFTVVCLLVLNEDTFEERRLFGDLEAPRVAVEGERMAAAAGEDGGRAPDERTAGADAGRASSAAPAPSLVLGERFGLTEREAEVAELMAGGRSKGYIAETLFVSENTVRSHAKHVYAKMGVHSRQELIDRFEEAGLR